MLEDVARSTFPIVEVHNVDVNVEKDQMLEQKKSMIYWMLLKKSFEMAILAALGYQIL